MICLRSVSVYRDPWSVWACGVYARDRHGSKSARLEPRGALLPVSLSLDGLRSLRIRKALDAYRRGKGSLAYAAEQAGVTLREMIPLAYAHGLTPKVDAALLDAPLSIEQAAEL